MKQPEQVFSFLTNVRFQKGASPHCHSGCKDSSRGAGIRIRHRGRVAEKNYCGKVLFFTSPQIARCCLKEEMEQRWCVSLQKDHFHFSHKYAQLKWNFPNRNKAKPSSRRLLKSNLRLNLNYSTGQLHVTRYEALREELTVQTSFCHLYSNLLELRINTFDCEVKKQQ